MNVTELSRFSESQRLWAGLNT